MNKPDLQKTNVDSKSPLWFYLVLIILPFFLVIILEVSLRLFNYGDDFQEWINLTDRIEILNPDIAKKYFSNTNNLPFSSESFLLKEKPENSFRIIALGASSAAGYPYQNSGSFTKYIRKAFEFSFPDKLIEVSNVSMAAINSYTILDLLPGIIEKKPDLIIIYLGHNEYYGVLGAASNQSLASSVFFTNLILKLKTYRIAQLVLNFLNKAAALIDSPNNLDSGTLMSQVADDKLIEYESEAFNRGLEQFESNLTEIYQLCSEANISVVTGTLVSNLKGLKPFSPVKSNRNPSADIVFQNAKDELNQNNFSKADSLFRLAKDLDGLRFRAPEIFNTIIEKLSAQFNYTIANTDSFLNEQSEYGIVGDNLMVDHLHPNLNGYQLLGELFFTEIVNSYFKKMDLTSSFSREKVNHYVRTNYYFTKYDSIVADFRIKILKNDWPFISNNNKNKESNLLATATFEGEVALSVLKNKISRKEAREKLTEYYYSINDFSSYEKELLAFSEEFPIDNYFLDVACNKLISKQLYTHVEPLLKRSYRIYPNQFNTKWLGIMHLSNINHKDAIRFLEESKSMINNDPQVLFNLAGAYLAGKNYELALQNIIGCLSIEPNYKNGFKVKAQIENLIKELRK